jgi:hypothetical protein
MRIGSWLSRIFHRRPVEARQRTPSTPAPTTPPRAPVDTFEPGSPMRVSLGKVSGYSASERQKLEQATGLLANVLNSREFRDAVLIYAAIRAAHESFTQAADGEVDLNVSLHNLSWFSRHVVGYTTPGSDTITTNRRFFSNYEPAEIAGHLGHEWLHKLGFEHDHAATADRPYSVPYAVGELIERLAATPLTPLPAKRAKRGEVG